MNILQDGLITLDRGGDGKKTEKAQVETLLLFTFL